MNQKQVVVRNLSTVVLTQALVWILSWTVNFYLPNYLTTGEWGFLNYAGQVAALLTSCVTLGTSSMLTREVAAHPARVGEFLAGALLIRLAIAAASLLVMVVAVPLLGNPRVVSLLIYIGFTALIIGMASEAFSAALQGLDRMSRGSLNQLMEKSIYASAILLCIYFKLSLFWIGIASLVSAVTSILMNLSAFRQLLPTLRMPHASVVRLLALGGLPFFAILLTRIFYGAADSLILRQTCTEDEMGWYFLALRINGMALMLPASLVAVLLPTLVRLYQEDEERMANLLQRMMTLVLTLVAPIALVMLFYPARLMFELLPYQSEKYAQAMPLIRIFGAGMLLWFLTQVTGTALNASRREKYMLRISITALIITVVGCLVLIPLTHRLFQNGAIGGAVVDVAVEAIVLIMMLAALPRHYFRWDAVGAFVKSSIATLPLLLIYQFLPSGRLWMWSGTLVGVACYGVLCLLLKIVGNSDLEMVRQSLRRKTA